MTPISVTNNGNISDLESVTVLRNIGSILLSTKCQCHVSPCIVRVYSQPIIYTCCYCVIAFFNSAVLHLQFGTGSFVFQEFFKLMVFDLLVTVATILVVDFFRGLFVRRFYPCWFWDLERTFVSQLSNIYI